MNKERYIIREKGTNNKVEYCHNISHSLSMIESLEARNRIDEVSEEYEIYDVARKEVILPEEAISLSQYIRNVTGMKRPEFSKKYGIPVRTLEDWDAGKKNPPDYVMDLLARAVFEDLTGGVVEFEVYSMTTKSADEWEGIKTKSITQALRNVDRGTDADYYDEIRVITDGDEDNYNIVEHRNIDF